MKVLLIVAGTIVAVIVFLIFVALVIGSRLPQAHVASRSIRLNRSPSEIYDKVRDFAESHKWRTDVDNVDMLGTAEDVRFRETGNNGVINYQLVEDVPNKLITTRIVDRDLGYAGSWTYEFSTGPEGTIVTITENGEVSNIFFRFMSRYVFGHTSNVDAYLIALASSFGQTVTPE